MANGMQNVTVVKAHLPAAPQSAQEEAATEEHPLDSVEAQAELDRIRDWWGQARLAQREPRAEMALDEAYYDGQQWDEEDAKVLEGRGQAALVFNKVKPTVDWVLGTERLMRVESTVLPRRKEESEIAQAKAELMKYVSDVNKLPYHQSRAFADSVKVGVGWLEHGIRSNPGEEPLYDRYESWRNVWYDHLAVEPDGSDARFLFRARWVDLEVAQAMFPDRAAELEDEAINTNALDPATFDDYGGLDLPIDSTASWGEADAFDGSGKLRRRVRLVECWYRKVEKVTLLDVKGRPEHGSILNQWDEKGQWLVKKRIATTFDAVKQVVYSAIFCGKTLLQLARSPYRHNRFPLSPIWCHRRGSDGTPYGMIRNLRDPQSDFNKRGSKSLYLLSSNRVIVDDDATQDWKEFRREVVRPDGILKKKRGSEIKLEEHTNLSAAHVELMDRDLSLIKEIANVPDESRGEETNATSGVAIDSRAKHGQVGTALLFDSLYYAIQASGEIRLSLIEQFYGEEKTIRITGDKKGQLAWMELNARQPDGSLLNPITQTKADFVVSQQDYRATQRQAMFESLMLMLSKLPPEVALNLLDLVVDMSDVPGREDLVARIRAINGQKDPAADPNDPATQAAEEEKRRRDEAQQRLAEETALAQLDLTKNQAKEAGAKATQAGIGALYSAIQTGQVLVMGPPGMAPVADEIAKSAGFQDQTPPPIFPEPQLPVAGIGALPQPRPNSNERFPAKPASPELGVRQGIETKRPDGVITKKPGGSKK